MLIRKIYRERAAELSQATEDRLTQEFIGKHEKQIEKKVIARLKDDVTNEQKKRLAKYEKELRKKKFEEVAKKWKERLTSGYRAKIEANLKLQIHKKMFKEKYAASI